MENYNDIKSKGVDAVVCIAVNDPFVMGAWGESHKADGKVSRQYNLKNVPLV